MENQKINLSEIAHDNLRSLPWKEKRTWISLSLSIISIIIAGYVAFSPLFGRDRIIVEGANELRIRQDWGNLIFDHFFSLSNIGKKQGTIVSIEGTIISKDHPFRKEVRAKNFYAYGRGDTDYFPILNITIKPNETWDSYFQLFEEPSRHKREQIVYYKNMWYDMKEGKTSYLYDTEYEPDKRPERTVPLSEYEPDQRVPPLAANRLLDFLSIKDFMLDSYKNFKEGQYEYTVTFRKKNKKEPFYTKRYSFVIYNSNLKELENSIKNYDPKSYSYQLRNEYIVVTLNPID